jgi:adenylosuccinate synthase
MPKYSHFRDPEVARAGGAISLNRSKAMLDALRDMREEDRKMQELAREQGTALEGIDETNADKLSRALGRSIDVVEEELVQDYRTIDPKTGKRLPKRDFAQLPERKLQLQVAMDVIKVSARIASDRLKGQRADVLHGLLREMRARGMVEAEPAPPTIGFGDDE